MCEIQPSSEFQLNSFTEPEKGNTKAEEKEEKGERRQLILLPGYLFPAYRHAGPLHFLKRSVN